MVIIPNHPTFLSPVEGGFSALCELRSNNIVLDYHPKSSHFLSPVEGGLLCSALCELIGQSILELFFYEKTDVTPLLMSKA